MKKSKMRKDMSLKEKIEYIVMYYKWPILGVCAAIGLMVFLVVHFCFPAKKPEFCKRTIASTP